MRLLNSPARGWEIAVLGDLVRKVKATQSWGSSRGRGVPYAISMCCQLFKHLLWKSRPRRNPQPVPAILTDPRMYVRKGTRLGPRSSPKFSNMTGLVPRLRRVMEKVTSSASSTYPGQYSMLTSIRLSALGAGSSGTTRPTVTAASILFIFLSFTFASNLTCQYDALTRSLGKWPNSHTKHRTEDPPLTKSVQQLRRDRESALRSGHPGGAPLARRAPGALPRCCHKSLRTGVDRSSLLLSTQRPYYRTPNHRLVNTFLKKI